METKRAEIEAGLINTLRRFATAERDIDLSALIETDEKITVRSAILFLYDREEAAPEVTDAAVLAYLARGGVMSKTVLIAAKIAQDRGIGRRQATEQAAVAAEVRRSLGRLERRGLVWKNDITKAWRLTEIGSDVATGAAL